MSISKIKTFVAIFAVAVAANAQFNMPENARRNALAGAPLPDIIDAYRYPVLMTGYIDHLQATWGGGVIGVKAINDVISVGVLANQGLMTPELFYALADSTLFDYGDAYYIPHLLLGFDLGGFRLGADIFFDYARILGTDKTSGTTSGPGVNESRNTKDKESASFITPGVRLSGAFDIGDMEFMAKFGIGFPAANDSWSYKRDSTGAAGTGSSAETGSDNFLDKGLYMEFGAEAGLSLFGTDMTFGGEYTFSDYRFTPIQPAPGERLTHRNAVLNFYAASEFNVFETAAAVVGYSFNRIAATDIHREDTVFSVGTLTTIIDNKSRETEATHTHTIAAGLENSWNNAWFFDNFQLRAGLRYHIFYEITSEKYKRSTTNGDTQATGEGKKRAKDPAEHSNIIPTLGIGLSKSILTLDMAFNMGDWIGVFAGPPVGMVTATIKF